MRKRELMRHIERTQRLAEKMQLNAQTDHLRILNKIRHMYDGLIETVIFESAKANLEKKRQQKESGK